MMPLSLTSLVPHSPAYWCPPMPSPILLASNTTLRWSPGQAVKCSKARLPQHLQVLLRALVLSLSLSPPRPPPPIAPPNALPWGLALLR